MRQADGTDFATYVDARWPDLVGGLEDEGVAPDDARLAVAEALVASRRSWARRVREENVDVTLWAEVRERAGLPPDAGGAAPHGVRRFDPRDAPDDWLSRAEQARRTRRRRGARVGLVWLVAAAALVGGWLWWASRPEPPPVREEANPLPVVWYAAGELHLERVVVDLPGIDEFVAVDDGVAARMRDGDLLKVDDDGGVSDLDESPAALDDPREAPPYNPVGRYDVLVQGVSVPDGGGWAYLLDSSRRDGSSDAVRQSESGRRALVVCTVDFTCGAPETILADGSIRLR